MDHVVLDHSLIAPLYRQEHPNALLDLGKNSVEICHRGKLIRGDAIAQMHFQPDKRLTFTWQPSDDIDHGTLGSIFQNDSDWDGKLRLVDSDVSVDVFCSSIDFQSGVVFVPRKSPFLITNPSKSLVKVIIHLLNFPDFNSPSDYTFQWGNAPHYGWKRCGKVVLSAAGWTITIAAMENTDAIVKALKKSGGYAITHMCEMTREDRTTFSSTDAEALITSLHYFLSFATGRWVGVGFSVGFDQCGKRDFEQWDVRTATRASYNDSWFDVRHGEVLSEVFPGFISLWHDSRWQKAIQTSLYWYLAASSRGTGIGVDTGLVLAQTALELLAWTYCVEIRKMVSERAFRPRGLTAADKFRLLASSLNIPLDLPASLPALQLKQNPKWGDSMHAITEIRNSIVHPHSRGVLPEDAYFEAWKLSLWYLDLILLRLCGHSGKYASRLDHHRYVGTVVKVPWA